MSTDLQTTIEAAWDARDTLGLTTRGPVREAVESAIAGLDDGSFRVADRQSDGTWQINQWLKKAVLLSFRLNDMALIEGGAGGHEARHHQGRVREILRQTGLSEESRVDELQAQAAPGAEQEDGPVRREEAFHEPEA